MTAAIILETDGALRLACPQCKTRLGDNLLECPKCHARYRHEGGIVSLNTSPENSQRSRTVHFGLFARVAQWWLWSRKLDRTLQFSRDLLSCHKNIVEISSGQSELLQKALALKGSFAIENLIVLAPNSTDLSAAKRNLANYSPTLVEVHFDKLPFEDRSVEAIACCDGLHRIAGIGTALGEISRVLAPTGRFRGAILLQSDSGKISFLENLLQRSSIQKSKVDLKTFRSHIKKAGLTEVLFEQQNAICHFELAPTCH